jgi:hypothetical protein
LTALEQSANLAIAQAHPFDILAAMRCLPEIRSLAGDPRYVDLTNRLASPN